MSESRSAFASLLDGEVSDMIAAALLTALRVKGETADELEGAVAAVRERMTPWESGVDDASLLDTCGTGGDGAGTVNISTAAGDCRGGLRRAGRQAWQPGRHWPLRQLRRPVRPGRCDHDGAGLIAPLPGPSSESRSCSRRHSTRACPARARATSTPVPNHVQPGRAAVQPRQSPPANSWGFPTKITRKLSRRSSPGSST